MNAAGWLVANGAVLAFSQRDAVALTVVRVLVADVTKFHGHDSVTHRRRTRGFSPARPSTNPGSKDNTNQSHGHFRRAYRLCKPA